MPVDQTGETIVFWVDHSGNEPHTEAHIQIEYEGDAEDFAWIIPVTAVPEVLVGSQALFDNMLQATVPTFTINTSTIGDCNSGFGCGGLIAEDLAGGSPNSFSSFGSTGGEDGGDTNGGPEILDRGFAGAFEYVTLTGSSVQEIVDWLDANGYAQDPDAPPILEEYLEDEFVFVAVKLKGGADVDEIHPLAVRYAGIEPCIPIKLTRIAAVDDMKIRALFLGESRLVPTNWPHVEVNLTQFDWVNGPATNYDQVVGAAIDEAGGRAFVTEYAGSDDIVSTSRIFEATWNAAEFEGIAPELVVSELASQGLAVCDGFECSFNHPQVQALLEIYLPPPDGVDSVAFWSCLECYVDQIDPVAWMAQPGFAADFDARIFTPGQHAVDMLSDATYLTRLFTLLSPHEMLEDPTFHETDALESVDNAIVATRVNDCGDGPSYIELPDGQQIALTDGGTMPDLEGNPAALRIQRVPLMGPPQVELDNADLIEELLAEYNDTRLVGPQAGNCSVGRIGLEALLGLFAIFGIAWFNRGGRRQ